MWWFDVMGASHAGKVVEGTWEGGDLVFRGEDTDHGEAQSYELRFTGITDRSHTLRMSGGPTGQPMKPQMESVYTKR